MAYSGLATKSLWGKQLGLQQMSTSVSGSATPGNQDFLVGASDIRKETTTADTTGTNLKAHGNSYLQGTSAASSCVYTLDPPIPGVKKMLTFGTANGPFHVKTANSETILTSAGSSWTVISASSMGGSLELTGVTTALWTSPDLASGTSSQASSFTLTTTT